MKRIAGIAVAILFGFAIWAAVRAVTQRKTAPLPAQTATTRTAPSDDAYRATTKESLKPFLIVALALRPGDVAALPPQFADLVAKTEEALVRAVVPADERESHLQFVLLLEQWNRANAGTAEDRAAALAKTRAVVEANSWIRP